MPRKPTTDTAHTSAPRTRAPAASPVAFRLAPEVGCATPTTPGLPYGGTAARVSIDVVARRGPAGAPSAASGTDTPAALCAAPKPPRDRSGDATRYRAGLTVRARNRRDGAAALPFGFSLDVRVDAEALAAGMGATLGARPRAVMTAPTPGATVAGYVLDAPAAVTGPDGAVRATGMGGRWLLSPAGAGRAFRAADRAWRITSPILRGAVDTRDDVLRGTEPEGDAGPGIAQGTPVRGTLPHGLDAPAAPGIVALGATIRATKGLRVAPGAALTVTVGVAGVTLRQVANLAATVANAAPYLDAATRGLDADAYLRDREPVQRLRAARKAAQGVEATAGVDAPAPRTRKAPTPAPLSMTPGTTPEALAGVASAAPVVRQVPRGAVEALRAAIGRRGKADATAPEAAALVAGVWATATVATPGTDTGPGPEGAAPCILDLGQLARGVVVFRLPGTAVPAELRAWVEAVTLFVGRALGSAHVRVGTNAVDTHAGPSLAARLAQGLRRLLHDAGMVGRTGPAAVSRAWLVHRVTGPTETRAMARLRAAKVVTP